MRQSVVVLLMAWLSFGVPTVHAEGADLGISLTDAQSLLETSRDQVLLIDVRDPVEIMFIGFTDAVDRNIPFLTVDRTRWDAEHNRFQLVRNPAFAAEVKALLAARGLDETATVITMCRSGSERGEPSAKLLQEAGLSNARFLIHGFQGSAAKEGPQKGLRVVNGWQNSGLPWSAKPNPDKIHRIN